MTQPLQYLLDTNVFIRALVKEDEAAFEQAKTVLEKCKLGLIRAHTHDLVLAELIWTLQSAYHQPKQVAIDAVEGIINLRGLSVESSFDKHLALELYRQSSVKYIDACLASVSQVQKKQWAIVSFDQDFKKLPVIWLKPKEL